MKMHGTMYGTLIGVLSTSNSVCMKFAYYVMILDEKQKFEIFTISWFLLLVAHIHFTCACARALLIPINVHHREHLLPSKDQQYQPNSVPGKIGVAGGAKELG